jgi:hypothetical protein
VNGHDTDLAFFFFWSLDMQRTKKRQSNQWNLRWPRALRESVERTAAELEVTPSALLRGLAHEFLTRRAGAMKEAV